MLNRRINDANTQMSDELKKPANERGVREALGTSRVGGFPLSSHPYPPGKQVAVRQETSRSCRPTART